MTREPGKARTRKADQHYEQTKYSVQKKNGRYGHCNRKRLQPETRKELLLALASHRPGSAARYHAELGTKRNQSRARQFKPCWIVVYRCPCAGQFFFIQGFRIMGRRDVDRKRTAGFDAGGPGKL